VKHRGNAGLVGSVVTQATHPFDVVGWDGCLYPYAFNVADFRADHRAVHQPPPVHQVFEGGNFVVCNFVPRKVDYHPLAVPVPYYHSNVDSDEVMFYVAAITRPQGIRDRRGLGVVTSGWPHARPAARVPPRRHWVRSGSMKLAVMVDTFRRLELGAAAAACEDPDYAWTWPGDACEGGHRMRSHADRQRHRTRATAATTLADPGAPGPGEIRVHLHATSLNFHDFGVANGRIPTVEAPDPDGRRRGVVEEVGPGVTEFYPVTTSSRRLQRLAQRAAHDGGLRVGARRRH